jgi:class 3 adenylate cyclase/tetratricopeptide (TPR) repeat protein
MSAVADRTAPPVEGRHLDAYVPSILLQHLAQTPDAPVRTLDGTALFTDISGFTKLSERLARLGRQGAEELVDAIDQSFQALLEVAHGHGASVVKFAGDALLLLFDGEGHLERGCASAVGMRSVLREAGRLETTAGKVILRMSQGLHSGELHVFVVGSSHRELILAGPGATHMTLMEKAAGPGQILVSPQTAARLPAASVGRPLGPGRLLAAEPPLPGTPLEPLVLPPTDLVAACLSTEVRAHLASGSQPPEHRHVTAAFVRFSGTDGLIEREGPEAAAEVLGAFVSHVQEVADQHQVCFLESDSDANGGKLMLIAGAPRMVGDDEERMLLALREIVTFGSPLEIAAGVNRGSVFCADVGPPLRRSFSVMGDTINLTARIASKAPRGQLYATHGVLERSATRFETVALEPFAVKGKKRPVEAWSVGDAIGSRAREGVALRFPLIGRTAELGIVDLALDEVRRRSGRLVDIVGEAGIGKTRVAEELRERAADLTPLSAMCEAYTSGTPYVVWRELLRPLIGVRGNDPDADVVARLVELITEHDPELLAWLPLIAIPFGADAPATPQTAELAPGFRRARLHEVTVRFLRHQLPTSALLLIEDAHLMDAASADLLHAVLAELHALPWLIVTTRRDAAGRGFQPEPSRALVSIELAGLPLEDATALAEAVTDADPLPPHLLELAVTRSGGNPQYLRDLLRAIAADGQAALPESIETAAMARIDLLAPPDRTLVRRAAVLGLSFHPRHLVDVLDAGFSEPDSETWDRLSSLFVDDVDGHLRFRRSVMREAAYAGLPFNLRRRLHAQVGARLEREHASDIAAVAASLSLHFSRAGDHERAWRYARLAGDDARERMAHADAAGSYRLALTAGRAQRVDTDELASAWEALADALEHTGELADAQHALRAARQLVRDQPLRVAELMLRHAQIAERAARLVPAVRWALRGLRTLEGLDDQRAGACRARTLAIFAAARQRAGRVSAAIELCHRAIVEAEAAGEDAALAQACVILDWALLESGRAAEAIHSPRALAIYERLGDEDRQGAVLNEMGTFAYAQGRWADAVSLYRRAAEASRRAGDVGNAAFGNCNIGEVLSDQGRYEEADAELRRALRVWRGSDNEGGAAFVMALLGRIAYRLGANAEARTHLEPALAAMRRLGAMGAAELVDAYRSEALAFAGEAQAALDAADLLLPGATQTAPLLHRVRGFALAQLGDGDAAYEALSSALAEARVQDSDYEIALSLDALDAFCGQSGPHGDVRPERDALLAKLAVVALPPAPLGERRGELASII